MKTGTFALTGLTVRPAQVWGAIRLVPLVRDAPVAGLRLDRRVYEVGDPSVVDVGDGTAYSSYIPHAFVASWGEHAEPAAAFGTQLQERPVQPRRVKLPTSGRAIRRLARRVAPGRLRFLPMHLAMEGYLALHFGGPEIVWEEWTDAAVRHGLSPRVEEAYCGAWVRGLADALRVFEIHPGQCGVALYVADALAGMFVVPHPADYRALHATLMEDLYGEVLFHYTTYVASVPDFNASIDADRVSSFADLRAEAARQFDDWARFHDDSMAAGLLGEDAYTYERVYNLGEFTLSRILPSFRLNEENHIGELITSADGQLAYCKTFRLSSTQVRRGYLLSRLHAHNWDLVATAEALGTNPAQLAARIEAAGFTGLLRHHVVARLTKSGRRPT
ncbi:ARPP-2 domain-containing protein [Yinghuangia sp. YIM S09857]|uniref:ARPP-2 domain-containing protein n=1 Tax=Yinghuangia sp. YIM S09857 TaxID=3436929 RepID=UPI003F539EAE